LIGHEPVDTPYASRAISTLSWCAAPRRGRWVPISRSATIEDTTVEDFDNLFAVNVRAPFFLVQQLLPALGNGSNIILTSSLAAHASVGTLAAYAATKGAIDTLVKHFATALGPRGIRVNAIAPGVVQTDMSSFTKTHAGRDFTLGVQEPALL